MTQAEQARQAARLALVEEHIRQENLHDLDALMKTWGESARYEDQGYREEHVGLDAVRTFYDRLTKAMPDIAIDVRHWHVTEDAVLVETVLRGTHLGQWRALPATGRRVEFRLCGVYTFDEQDRIACERIYYDRAEIWEQLGIAYNMDSPRGRIVTALTHPLTMLRILARRVHRR